MGYSIFDETMVDLSWDKLDELIKEEAVVLFPTGVIEAHGPHMSLGVDTYGSYIKCKLVKELLESKGIKTLNAPPYYWGINNMTGDFPEKNIIFLYVRMIHQNQKIGQVVNI